MAEVYYTIALYSYIKEKRRKNNLSELEKKLWELKPKWTAVVPAYNEEENIRESLESIINQTYPPVEIIILDDHSTDNTPREVFNLLKEYNAQPIGSAIIDDSKQLFGSGQRKAILRFKIPKLGILFTYVRNLEKNVGKTMNLNWAAFNLVKTPYFANIDGDTILEKDYAEKVLPLLLEENVAAAYGFPIPIINRNNSKTTNRYMKNLISSLILSMKRYTYTLSHYLFKQAQDKMGFIYNLMGCAVFYNAEVFKKIPRPNDSYAGDTSHAWELQAAGYKIRVSLDGFVYTTEPETLRKFIRQRIRWGAGPFQNLYLRGKKVILSFWKNKNYRSLLGALWTFSFTTLFSIKYGSLIILLPILSLTGHIPFYYFLYGYLIDFIYFIGAGSFSYSIKYKYRKNWTFLDHLKSTFIHWLIGKYLWSAISLYNALKTIIDITKKKKWEGLH